MRQPLSAVAERVFLQWQDGEQPSEEVSDMAEERKETWQEQPVVATPSPEPTATPARGGGFLLGFIVGALIGVLVTFAFTWFAWKIPMDNALKEVQAREQQLRISQDREKKLRDALQEAQDAINRALGSLGTSTTTESASPATAPTPSPPSR